MLSILNALWFGRICSMIVKGLQKRKAPEPSTLSDNRIAQKQSSFDKTSQDPVVGYSVKGAADASEMRERRQADGIKAVH